MRAAVGRVAIREAGAAAGRPAEMPIRLSRVGASGNLPTRGRPDTRDGLTWIAFLPIDLPWTMASRDAAVNAPGARMLAYCIRRNPFGLDP